MLCIIDTKEKGDQAGGQGSGLMARLFRPVDMLHGDILKALLWFMVPILISNMFQQLYNTVDTMIVGHVLGETSLAAIGACTPVYDLLVGFALGIGRGLAIVTARSFGSGDRKLLKRSVACAIVIGAGVSIVITILGRMGARPLMVLLQTPEEILEESLRYIQTITLFTTVMFAYNLCAGLLQAIGNSLMPLVFLMLSSVLNIGLDLLFIAKLGVGIQGAAVATVIAQGISVVLSLIYIACRCQMLVPQRSDFHADQRLYREMLAQGLSMGFMSCIVSAGSVILQYGINGLGYLTIAGHTAARKLFLFCMMPFSSMSMAMATFVSQNRGAGNHVRIYQSIRKVRWYSVIMAAILTVLLGFAAPAMVTLISGSTEEVILHNGSMYLRVVAPFLAVLGVLNSTRNALQGMGQKLLPLVSSVIELIGKILFVILLIPYFGYGAVIFCEPVIWCVMTVQLSIAFFRDPYIVAAKRESQKQQEK